MSSLMFSAILTLLLLAIFEDVEPMISERGKLSEKDKGTVTPAYR